MTLLKHLRKFYNLPKFIEFVKFWMKFIKFRLFYGWKDTIVVQKNKQKSGALKGKREFWIFFFFWTNGKPTTLKKNTIQDDQAGRLDNEEKLNFFDFQ